MKDNIDGEVIAQIENIPEINLPLVSGNDSWVVCFIVTERSMPWCLVVLEVSGIKFLGHYKTNKDIKSIYGLIYLIYYPEKYGIIRFVLL